MIIDRMTDEEIRDEARREYNVVWAHVQRLIPQCRRPVIKANKFPIYFKPVEYISKRRNHYIIYLEARCKADYNNMLVTVICTYDRGGKHALMFVKPPYYDVNIYSPHLFSRYRTRFLKDESISPVEVMNRFFKINPTIHMLFTGDEEIAGVCNEGVLLGIVKDNNIFVWKTYLSFNILFEDQIDFKEGIHEALIKYREELQ